MAGVLRYPMSEVWPLTYALFLSVYEAYLLSSWDHTASLLTVTHNLTVVTCNINSKRKQKYKSMSDFHPFRKKGKAHGIRQDNFGVLKHIGNAFIKGKV